MALHVYGGDFFTAERSEWDFETYEERPRDFERTRRLFDEANARWADEQRGRVVARVRPSDVRADEAADAVRERASRAPTA